MLRPRRAPDAPCAVPARPRLPPSRFEHRRPRGGGAREPSYRQI